MSERTRRLIRFLLAAVFIYTGVVKLLSTPADRNTIYGRTPAWLQAILPYGELGLAAWLVSDWFPTHAALTSIAVLSLFSGVIGAELRKPNPSPCGCGPPRRCKIRPPSAVRCSSAWGETSC